MGISLDQIKNPALRARIIELDREQNYRPMGPVSDTKRQQNHRPAVGKGVSDEKERPKGVGYRVHIISVRAKLLDEDNFITGAKFLRDAIAETLGLDDASGAGIEFEYAQCLTRGEQGSIVRIEML